MTLRAAVIGLGRISREHLACLHDLPAAHLAAVCDLSPIAAEAAGERFGAAAFSDHAAMLRDVRPDIVHITTPAPSHFALTSDCLRADAHVIVEKPITVQPEQFVALRELAESRGRMLIEDHNYLFNPPMRRILDGVRDGHFGDVVHAELVLCLDILAPGGHFVDRNAPHPALALAGGAISDFLPHLAYLAHAFTGPHQSVQADWLKRTADSPLPADEFRALIAGERATASLTFSAHAQPEGFWVRVYGTRMYAEANLFENGLMLQRMRDIPRPLNSLFNALGASRDFASAGLRSLWGKLGGAPNSYAGMRELVERTYHAIEDGGPAPIPADDIDAVSRLAHALARTAK